MMRTAGVILACLATSAAFDPAGVIAALDSAVAPAIGSALKVLGQDAAAAVIESSEGAGAVAAGGAAATAAWAASGIAPAQIEVPLEVLEGTYLEDKELERCYKASRDGWSALDFHQRVDFKGACVLVGETIGGARFGAFNPLGWRSTDDYSSSTNAFLFAMPSGKPPVKVPVNRGGEAALFDYARGGPCFGSNSLIIGAPQSAVMGGFTGPDVEDLRLGQGSLRAARSSLGGAYQPLDARAAGRNGLLGQNTAEARLREIEVYYAPEQKQSGQRVKRYDGTNSRGVWVDSKSGDRFDDNRYTRNKGRR